MYCSDCGGTGAAENGYECSGCWGAGWTPSLAMDEFNTSPERNAQRAALLGAICEGTIKVEPRRRAKNPRREGYERDNTYVGTTDIDIVRLEAARQMAIDAEAEPGDEEHAALIATLDSSS